MLDEDQLDLLSNEEKKVRLMSGLSGESDISEMSDIFAGSPLSRFMRQIMFLKIINWYSPSSCMAAILIPEFTEVYLRMPCASALEVNRK